MTGQYGSTGQIPPPIPSRIPRPMPQSYQQPFMGSAYSNYTNGYGYGNNLSYRGIGNAYGSYGGFRHPYLDSGYTSQFGGPSGDVENRQVAYKTKFGHFSYLPVHWNLDTRALATKASSRKK